MTHELIEVTAKSTRFTSSSPPMWKTGLHLTSLNLSFVWTVWTTAEKHSPTSSKSCFTGLISLLLVKSNHDDMSSYVVPLSHIIFFCYAKRKGELSSCTTCSLICNSLHYHFSSHLMMISLGSLAQLARLLFFFVHIHSGYDINISLFSSALLSTSSILLRFYEIRVCKKLLFIFQLWSCCCCWSRSMPML